MAVMRSPEQFGEHLSEMRLICDKYGYKVDDTGNILGVDPFKNSEETNKMINELLEMPPLNIQKKRGLWKNPPEINHSKQMYIGGDQSLEHGVTPDNVTVEVKAASFGKIAYKYNLIGLAKVLEKVQVGDVVDVCIEKDTGQLVVTNRFTLCQIGG